jgi:chemotaxis protein methyltransferase CheR
MAFTFFFRDAQTLELLIEQALPTLCGQAFIRIWDAGCAHGPEPYTLAMLLRERMSDFVFRNVRIHASDVDPHFGPHVAAAIYAEQEVQRIPAPIRARYFQRADELGHVQVVEEIRAKVSFTEHNLLSLRPLREDFSLIICKNVLLHFDEAQRREVFRTFHRALRPGGLLATEHTQKLPADLQTLFEPAASYAQIFRRLDASETARKHIDGSHAPLTRGPQGVAQFTEVVNKGVIPSENRGGW